MAREGLEDVDLSVAEYAHLITSSDDDAEKRRALHDRHAEDGPFVLPRERGHELRAPFGVVLGIREDVDDLHGRLLQQHPSDDRGSFFDEPTLSSRLSRQQLEPCFVGESARARGARDVAADLAVRAKDGCVIRMAELDGVLDDRPEHAGKVFRRLAHRFEDLADRDLALERLASLGGESRIVDRDRGLVSECANQRDLAVAERAHVRPDERQHSNHARAAKERNSEDGAVAELDSVLPKVVGVGFDGGIADVEDILALKDVLDYVRALDRPRLSYALPPIANLVRRII